MTKYIKSALLGLFLSCVPTTSIAAFSPYAVVDGASSAVIEVESYLEDSTKELDHMLEAMQTFSKDQKNVQKAMALMHAVKSFESSTSRGYARVRLAVAGIPVLRDALEVFRSDQASLARRLLNADIETWDPMLAETRRLEEFVREAARSPLTT